MDPKVLLITPAFTQLNTPYPATAYLKGFLNTKDIQSSQLDMGLEVILELFSKKGLTNLFQIVKNSDAELDENLYRIFSLRDEYIQTIDFVISFLQNQNPTLGHLISGRSFLPEASRFNNIVNLDEAFGQICIQDKAKYIATLYLEDLSDFIKEVVDPHFGFSRYAERLGRMASSFDFLLEELENEDSLISKITVDILEIYIQEFTPDLVCLSIPFPGNLFSALKIGQYLKRNYPFIKIVAGGGFVNTELRSLQDKRVFNFFDYICLDDGEAPLLFLLEHLKGIRDLPLLKRVFTLKNHELIFIDGAIEKDIPQRETGTPDYRDLKLGKYLSVIEIANPMHRLWSDGRWNKLTLAHGCYWGKCSFCDISLDYISRYEPLAASDLCDKIETIISQTGTTGFHFVDEAAPPALMGELALELIRRKMKISWWTNIRFEKTFTNDLCKLLKASGCIAISGGLEVASDRLLSKMKKGVTVAQVAEVAYAFSKAEILVHAYLMYGFPSQTKQETIDSLEVVRQMFVCNIIQSGFWHRFAMTAHSPVGLNPTSFGVKDVTPKFLGFADNDRDHIDPEGADHDIFSAGLSTSLFNYMNGLNLDEAVSFWFEEEMPHTTLHENYIADILEANMQAQFKLRTNAIIIWLGAIPEIQEGALQNSVELIFYDRTEDWLIELPEDIGKWLYFQFHDLKTINQKPVLYSEFIINFESKFAYQFSVFSNTIAWKTLREKGLLII
ncbi:MAG: radical SAM protein [Saprospiraceae bacterium]